MSWLLLFALILALLIALLAAWSRRADLARMQAHLERRGELATGARADGRLMQPVVDLSRCLGCGTCVRACPEGGVLELVHGQAVVVEGARCVGHAVCARECPVGAIAVRLADVANRRDIPALTEELEARGTRGLFLAGEVTAHTLIRNAVEQGRRVARTVAERLGAERGGRADGVVDLCIVGAGPAGLACALEARAAGLSFELLDRATEIGGTVAQYPRSKLVLTQPVELAPGAALERDSYAKEELVALWQQLARDAHLVLRGGEEFRGLERASDGSFVVRTQSGSCRARCVCLALGRRGTPNRLGVPGEELPKVAYALLDARAHSERRVAVVGGGDSAVETALALAEQPGNTVTLVHRRADFPRLRARNAERLARARSAGRLRVATRTRVRSIAPDALELESEGAAAPQRLENDELFVLAGGTPAVPLLESAGVSFDPAAREPAAVPVEQGTGLVPALAIGLVLALCTLAFALWQADYYLAPVEQRPTLAEHGWLRPSRGLGLGLAWAAVTAITVNLLYLARRAQRRGFRWGSLRDWMTSHVASGVLALLCALLHAAMAPRDSAGGHALLGLAVLLATGAIGRYLYAWIPRAANGRELALEEVRAEFERAIEAWTGERRAAAERLREDVLELVRARQWGSSWIQRAWTLLCGRRELGPALSRARSALDAGQLGAGGAAEREALRSLELLARHAYRHALVAAHYEDLRGLVASWRYLHRWIALLVVLLIAVHVAYALGYGGVLAGAPTP